MLAYNDQVFQTLFIFAVLMFLVLALNLMINLHKARQSSPRKRTLSVAQIRDHELKRQLEKNIVTSAKPSKRHQTELIIAQSGFHIRYAEYKLLCVTFAIILPFLSFFTLKNIWLSLILIIVGYAIPGQFVMYVRNRRLAQLDKQIETFMEIFVERYKLTQVASIAFEQTIDNFKGKPPLFNEMVLSLSEMSTGENFIDVFDRFSKRVNNKYLVRLTDNIRLAEDIGTFHARSTLALKALEQFRTNKSMRIILQEKIEESKRESLILLVAVPGVMVYQSVCSEGYMDFMLNTTMGKGGLAFIVGSCLGCVWFINKKIGAPLD